MSASNTRSQDVWDELCVNPHQKHMDMGRHEGREAGLQAGFNDGFALGRSKGIEYGMELGFILGFLHTIEMRIQSNQGDDTARIEKKLDDLRQAIDDFPRPDTIFSCAETMQNSDPYIRQDDSEAAVYDGTDILGAMQRIRAKFKVLLMHLKIPHFSLKQVMSDAGSIMEENGENNNNEKQVPQHSADETQGLSSEW